MDIFQPDQPNATDIIRENQILITKIFTAQCSQDYDTSTNLCQQLMQQMNSTLQLCQQNPKCLQAIREYREILPESCIQKNEENVNETNETYLKYLQKVVTQQKQHEKRSQKKKNPWTKEEKKLFEDAMKTCDPKDWKQISALIKSRSPQQVRSHYQKYLRRQRKIEINTL